MGADLLCGEGVLPGYSRGTPGGLEVQPEAARPRGADRLNGRCVLLKDSQYGLPALLLSPCKPKHSTGDGEFVGAGRPRISRATALKACQQAEGEPRGAAGRSRRCDSTSPACGLEHSGTFRPSAMTRSKSVQCAGHSLQTAAALAKRSAHVPAVATAREALDCPPCLISAHPTHIRLTAEGGCSINSRVCRPDLSAVISFVSMHLSRWNNAVTLTSSASPPNRCRPHPVASRMLLQTGASLLATVDLDGRNNGGIEFTKARRGYGTC